MKLFAWIIIVMDLACPYLAQMRPNLSTLLIGRWVQSTSSVFAFLILTFLSSQIYAQGKDPLREKLCSHLLTVKTGAVQIYTDKTTFRVEVPKQSFLFEGTLNEGGVLSISAVLVFQEWNERSHLRGSELYEQMMNHFGLENIKVIKGSWHDETNFDAFFANLKQGLSEEDAAKQTWSGRQAKKYGFSRVRTVEVRNYQSHILPSVYVEFVR